MHRLPALILTLAMLALTLVGTTLVISGVPMEWVLVAMPLIALVLLAMVGWLTREHTQGAANPAVVYAMLLALAGIAGSGGWFLSLVGPLVVISIVVVLAVIATAHALYRSERRRSRRAVQGRCTECAYDLRASHDRCPECGAALPEELQRRRRIAAELAAKRAEADADRSADVARSDVI